MASSSTSFSSHLIPASDSQSHTYDVFLSFRGEDTRNGFVGHLYTALEKEGIYTYKDDKTLAQGESIGPALSKAIEESHIVVIVFSKNYANSSWCLDELVHIIECMDKRKQNVLPVFYDVDPSDVRKQKGIYEVALKKHEFENKNKVESWIKALVEAANLSGWVLSNFANGDEAKCIEDIVGKISSRLFQLVTNVNKDFIGIENRLQDLISKLIIECDGVHMIGIWGVGGGGKTTLASAAYMEISHHFEAHCLLQNIREESYKHGLEKLQEKILSSVLKRNERVGSEIQGRTMIKKRLHNKKVLVVLDDVDDLKQLEALAGSHDWFGKGSRIIITTRNCHLLRNKGATIYEVSLLSPIEATTLFCRHAFKKDKPKEGYENLTHDVVSYANGLPLALEVLGSFLYDKDKYEWKSALAELKCIPNNEVTKTLKISYDGLEPHRKGLFLDIACFMRGWELDEAMRVLDACGFHPGIGIRELVQKSLIKVSNRTFEMHDLVEEMARYIVRGDHSNNPEKHSRIWEVNDLANFCDMWEHGKLKETEVLHLKSYEGDPRLRNVVANMKKLRWIEWEMHPASSLPSHFKPTQLNLMCIQQKQLWEGCKSLPNLKILHLSYSRHLTRTPNFEGLPCLERLVLFDCKALEEIHSSIGYHNNLVFLDIRLCMKLKMFPPIISMKKLETLLLRWCKEFQKFPEIQTSMDSLLNLDLSGTKIEIIPKSVGRFCTNLVSCCLYDCDKLRRIKADFRLLKSLKYLDLGNCKLLSPQSTSFNFSLRRSYQKGSVSRKVPQFPCFIRKLCLSGCNLEDGDIPSDICELLNLQVLDLSQNQFSQLHSSLSRIRCLKFLNLSECKSLVELPDLPSSIAILKANSCDSLQSIGDLSNYKWLWKVSLWRKNTLSGCGSVLHSMVQASVAEDRFMNFNLPSVRRGSSSTSTSITLQLPHNWYSDFSGFLFCVDYELGFPCSIVIKQEGSIDSQPDNDYWKEFDENQEYYEYSQVGYVPFGSLRHIPWWNSAYTKKISFETDDWNDDLKVGLVPRKSKIGDSSQTSNATIIDSLKFWDEEYADRKTFEIIYDSRSSNIQIDWRPAQYLKEIGT